VAQKLLVGLPPVQVRIVAERVEFPKTRARTINAIAVLDDDSIKENRRRIMVGSCWDFPCGIFELTSTPTEI
jgi:hypothetical protein